MARDKETEEKMRYRENTGKDAVTRFPDDPDWKYRGTKDEREELELRVRQPAEQNSLFEEETSA